MQESIEEGCGKEHKRSVGRGEETGCREHDQTAGAEEEETYRAIVPLYPTFGQAFFDNRSGTQEGESVTENGHESDGECTGRDKVRTEPHP